MALGPSHPFVMRVSRGFYPEVYDTTEDDAVISIGSRPNGRGVSREKELPYVQALSLYFGRWGVEAHDDDVKNKWGIENFSGHTPVVIEQDFAATIVLSNLATVVEEDAHAEADERRRQSP